MSRSSQHDPTDGEPHEQPADGAPDPDAGRDAAAAGETPPSGAEPAPAESGTAEAVKEPTPLTQQLGRAVIVLLVVLFAVFAVDNSQPVDFSWVFGGTTVDDDPSGSGQAGGVPLIVLLLIAFVIGGLIGSFVSWQLARSRRRRER